MHYYRIMLGRSGAFLDECVSGGFLGADFETHQDLTAHLPGDWRAFNKSYIPIFMNNRPDKSKVALLRPDRHADLGQGPQHVQGVR